jgi:hypothetical protein
MKVEKVKGLIWEKQAEIEFIERKSICPHNVPFIMFLRSPGGREGLVFSFFVSIYVRLNHKKTIYY